MGVVDCDNLLLLLGVPREMTQEEREISNRLLMEGFKVGYVVLHIAKHFLLFEGLCIGSWNICSWRTNCIESMVNDWWCSNFSLQWFRVYYVSSSIIQLFTSVKNYRRISSIVVNSWCTIKSVDLFCMCA